MKKLLKAGLILMGAMAFTLTLANATCGSGKEAPKMMKGESGKCDTGKSMTERGKCNADRQRMNRDKCNSGKPMMERGKCNSDKPGRSDRCGTDGKGMKKEEKRPIQQNPQQKRRHLQKANAA
jgi:hypothetical protein